MNENLRLDIVGMSSLAHGTMANPNDTILRHQASNYGHLELERIKTSSTDKVHVDGLVQEIRNSGALAMELCLSCTKPSMLYMKFSDGTVIILYSGTNLAWAWIPLPGAYQHSTLCPSNSANFPHFLPKFGLMPLSENICHFDKLLYSKCNILGDIGHTKCAVVFPSSKSKSHWMK